MTSLDDKLEQARNNASNYGRLRGLKEIADDKLKIVYAQLYENSVGTTVSDRDAWVKRQPEYSQAVEDKSNAFADWVAAEAYMKLLLAEVEKYRSDLSYQKHIDEAHR